MAPGHIEPLLGSAAIVAAGAGAAGALNMWYDADIDAVMDRTAMRPIPLGKVGSGRTDRRRSRRGGALRAGIDVVGIPIQLSSEITFNVFVKNVIQPLLIFGAAWALGLKGAFLAQTFLLGGLPTATEVSAIAVSRNI